MNDKSSHEVEIDFSLNQAAEIVLEALDLKVNRLIRLSFGPFQLGQLESGKVEEVPRRVLRQQLGKNWQAIVDGTIPKDGDAKGAKPKRKKDHASDKR